LAVAAGATLLFPSLGSGLICACSAQEADKSFNRHQLPLPQQLRAAHPGVVIAQDTRVFLHNADTRHLLRPFYAMRTSAREDKVLLLYWGFQSALSPCMREGRMDPPSYVNCSRD
jgi:hypothetical protein